MLQYLIGCYRYKKARKSLDIQAFLVFLGSIETFVWWRRGDLNPRPSALPPRLYMFRFR